MRTDKLMILTTADLMNESSTYLHTHRCAQAGKHFVSSLAPFLFDKQTKKNYRMNKTSKSTSITQTSDFLVTIMTRNTLARDECVRIMTLKIGCRSFCPFYKSRVISVIVFRVVL